MKEYQTTKGQSYIVTSKDKCEVKGYSEDNTEYLLLTVPANSQGVFIAISNKTVISSPNAVIIPFEEASISVGAGGGISEDELINFGLLEEWTTEDEKLVKHLGTLSGAGNPYPTFNPLNGIPFTYSLTDGAEVEFNRVEICVKTAEIPTLIIGGMRCTYLSHRMEDDYYYIIYNTFDERSPDAKLKLNNIEVIIVGAQSVGGGQVQNPSVQGYTLSENVDYYPYVKLSHVKKTEHVGIETAVYEVSMKENETNKILPFSNGTTSNINSLLEGLIRERNLDVVLNLGKLSTTGDEVITSATIYVHNNAISQQELELTFRQMIEVDSRGKAKAMLYRIH